MHFIWYQMLKIAKSHWGPRDGGACDVFPHTPIVVRGLLPSAIAAARLNRGCAPHNSPGTSFQFFSGGAKKFFTGQYLASLSSFVLSLHVQNCGYMVERVSFLFLFISYYFLFCDRKYFKYKYLKYFFKYYISIFYLYLKYNGMTILIAYFYLKIF